MGPKPRAPQGQDLFRSRLDAQINMRHPLVRLAQLIKWEEIERTFSVHFTSTRGRPALPPRLAAQIGRYAHAKQFKRMRRALRILKTRVGRVYREIERKLDQLPAAVQDKARELLARVHRILNQQTKDKHKLYALHAPQVECISKGKARHPYEFGVKVTVATTLKEGLVVGMRSMPGNPWDGHTLAETIEQVSILAEQQPKLAVVDKGYQGVVVEGLTILRSGQRRGVTRTMRQMIHRRSAIEPTIGHMKTDGRLARNPLKGALGDALHAVLCGAGHNIRLLLRKLRLLCAQHGLQPSTIWALLRQLQAAAVHRPSPSAAVMA